MRAVAAARELRDRWLEQVNAGKYDVSRALPETPVTATPSLACAQGKLLPAA